ncbi:DUF5799 family protein [Halanaeroarchaeum sulfurireducens]|uniref:Uncharacterized protein n=1 Tax=Halanaeroarchaeum sulfurireducens TaxID=1604004 RepID=A0A0F7PEK3_9EURY|nr:DUF5799 family protein [Halanaeroarchaeum sulfurireducens]AKH98024.1 hypothetical protein HLASF_1545 [Halanaeroarchaeum sulfurireducens]ALG82418.1 hypothetical protein HLASA_1532 [Halanaeroarchaeum sulfurireducens]
MADESWHDRVVGARMSVDDTFEDRVVASSFSRQQWNLLMTAVEFEIVDAEDPERARIVADTDGLDAVLPELDALDQGMAAMGGSESDVGGSAGGGLVDSIKGALGMRDDGSVDDTQRAEAVELTQAYADTLQTHLEEQDRWEEIREIATQN